MDKQFKRKPDVSKIRVQPNLVDTVVVPKLNYPPKIVDVDKDNVVQDVGAIKLLLDFYHIDPQKVWVVKDAKDQWKVIAFSGAKFYFPKDEPATPMKVNI